MKSRSIRACAALCVFVFGAIWVSIGCSSGTRIACNAGTLTCSRQRFLYATALNQVLTFQVDPTNGSLNPPVAVSNSNDSVSLTASGSSSNYLYVADVTGNAIDAYSIAPGGVLTPISGATLTGVPRPSGLTSDSAKRFLFAPNAVATGATVSVLSIDSTTGALTPVVGSPFPAVSTPSSATVDPSNKFLYVGNLTGPLGEISAYSINASTGALTPVPGSPYTTLPSAGPSGLAVDPSGKFLYVALTNKGMIAGFSIDPNSGALTPIPGSPSFAGTQPMNVVFDQTGSFLYSNDVAGNAVLGFAVDGNTGTLTPLTGSPFSVKGGKSPFGLAVFPGNGFSVLYVSNNATGNISALAINQTTGALTSVSGSPFVAAPNPVALTVNP